MIQSYKDLKVYEKSYNLAIELYKEMSSLPQEERYGLISQIKRAATSIPLNIAEGYGKRMNVKEFKRFLMMSIGSSDEVKVLLDFCKDLGYMPPEKWRKYTEGYEEVGRMLSGLYQKWE